MPGVRSTGLSEGPPINRPRPLWGLAVLGACLLSAGCGTFGGTTSFVLRDGIPRSDGIRLSLASFAREHVETGKAMAVGVFGFSGFDADDEKNLRDSLAGTLKAVQEGAPPARRDLDLHVLVRRYLVAASNNQAATLACVAWALADGPTVLYSQQFYATDSVVLLGTVGGTKVAANEGIVRRIATHAAWAASSARTRGDLPIVKGTYDSIDEAARTLPGRMTTSVSAGGTTRVTSARPGWRAGEPETAIDWAARLADVPVRSANPPVPGPGSAPE